MISYQARRHQRVADCESGQASMVTVAMFMMLFAAIAVSFTFVVISASRQALNDSLQSSAKAAAESGVEDAKRLIVYCYNKRSGGSYTTPDAQQLCPKVIGKLSDQLEGMGCDEILGKLDNPNYNNSFAVEDEGGRGHRVRVGNNGSNNNNENNEYYQCLKIATKTDNYQGMVNNLGKSIIVPLRVVDTQNQAAVIASLKIEWHRNVNGNDGDNPAEMNGAEGTGLPPANIWSSSNRPAVLRVERVGVPKGNFTLDQLADSDTALIETRLHLIANIMTSMAIKQRQLLRRHARMVVAAITNMPAKRRFMESPLIPLIQTIICASMPSIVVPTSRSRHMIRTVRSSTSTASSRWSM